MSKTIKYLTIAALSLGALAVAPQDAKAGDYCREYTRSVYIGGRVQEAYGTACLQPNGDWMIVGEGLGNDIPANVTNVDYVIHDGRRNYAPPRVVYYDRSPIIYRSRALAPAFTWYHNGHYKNGHYVKYKRDRDWHDNHRWNGRGRGHDRHDHDRRRGHDRGREGVSIRYDWRN